MAKNTTGNRVSRLDAEAAAQFHKGLDQLTLLPDGPDRQRQELEFWSALGAVLMAVKGQAAPEAGDAYAHARELWERLGSPSEFLHVPYGQSRYHVYRGEFDLAMRLDEDLLRLSRHRYDSEGLLLGHAASVRVLMLLGWFTSCRSHAEEVLALYDRLSRSSLVHTAGFYPHVGARAVLGVVLFCLGFPERALTSSNMAIVEARRLAHPPSSAVNWTHSTALHWLLGKIVSLDEQANQLVAVATEQSFPHWRAQGTIYRGWVKVKRGEVADGISLLRAGLAAYRATGAEAWMLYYRAVLASAYEIAGQIEAALVHLDDAVHIVERTEERWYAAELYRHKGRLLMRQGHAETAEGLYRTALTIAQEQEAKLWELRAAVSLARRCRDQGRRAEARDVLAPVYGWFTEAFDTADLKESKALLDELDA